ncbi:hypothetical protein BDZ94DRAFT_1310487 [Collybia nuda]|uniref:Uncharacterized protein n=1 Tax=Collybia nuda TaxID=64659 RepID=A0A9P5Y3I0_9AGAR|nr:hypothetical protein BDZ94DRAFT_1310487 [Collybia nuda]
MAWVLRLSMNKDPSLTLHKAYSHIEKYLLEQGEAPMPNLYILLRGLAGLHSAEQSMVLFNAPDLSGTSATFGEHTLTLCALKNLHLDLIRDVQNKMDDLLFHDLRFTLHKDQTIFDEPRERRPGYSFVTDTRNSWTRERSVVQHILDTPHLFSQFAYLDPQGCV